MDNIYRYDVMDNIVGLIGQGKPQTLQDGKSIGGSITHTYSYDEWDRLIGAKGIFNGGSSKSATYDLRMEYDKLYNVTKKQLNLTQNDLQFQGSLTTGYELTYNYKEDDPFRLESIDTKQYSKDGEAKADTIFRVNNYNFDNNGNLTLQLTDTERDSSHCADTMGTKVKNHLWDEENRLLAINDNGFVSNYFYDASGERTVKLSKPDLYVYVNSAEKINGDSLPMKFVGYVNPYLVVTNGGHYTKHIYAGTQRIASKLGDINAFGADPRRVAKAGHDVDNAEPIDFSTKYKNQNSSLSSRYDSLKVKSKPKENNDYVNGKSFCCGDNSLDEIEKNETNSAENAKLEDNLYFYHPDHLGSTSMVTNYDGEVTQNVAYIPYGEVFVEERNGSWATPFLFNAKELDEETGLYYYGARYLNPTVATWLSVDPKIFDYPGMSPYNYCAGNPVKMVDPDGMKIINSDESPYTNEVEDYVKLETEFYNKYGENADNLEKGDFKNDKDFNSYKKSKKELKESYNRTKHLERALQNTQEHINEFKKRCPDLYDIMDNLTYFDANGDEVPMDIYITSNSDNLPPYSPSTESTGGAFTIPSIKNKKNEPNNFKAKATIMLGFCSPSQGGYLAHEFGHVMSFSMLPILYYNNSKRHGGTHNCQEELHLPLTERSFTSMWAIEYQKIFLGR